MSEFNIGFDPEAAKTMFDSVEPTVMVGLKVLVYPEDSQKIKAMNKVGEMFYGLFKRYRGGSTETGLTMYDSTAIHTNTDNVHVNVATVEKNNTCKRKIYPVLKKSNPIKNLLHLCIYTLFLLLK
ncbi:hypothetical protein AX762_05600 [Alkalibacterium sp. 20]|nr:hypothetical protein AX762_05600 [Alkalibacterium sp. 20]